MGSWLIFLWVECHPGESMGFSPNETGKQKFQ